jgi:hypothetical protein
MPDTETFKRKRGKKIHKEETFDGDHEDDFPSMFTDLTKNISWKVAGFLFLIMVFIQSDAFIETILRSFDGTVDNAVTTKGTMIQIIFTVIAYIVIDLLVKGGIL